MRKYPFVQVDAFTDQPLSGNPCAVFFESDDLDDETMLSITREMNLSESAFIRQSSNADFGVRYFTPMGEIPLAGHPTIASTHALIERGLIRLTGSRTNIVLELKVGLIGVAIAVREGQLPLITMQQMKPIFLKKYEPDEVLPVFGLDAEDLLPGVPLQTVSTGTAQLMVCVRSLDVLQKINVNQREYLDLFHRSDWFSSHFFCLQGINPEAKTFARHFSPPPDLFEDPFTGSATGGMAAFLWHYSVLDQPCFIAEQGHWMQRPGQAQVEVVGPRGDIETVRVGGTAVTVLRGVLELP